MLRLKNARCLIICAITAACTGAGGASLESTFTVRVGGQAQGLRGQVDLASPELGQQSLDTDGPFWLPNRLPPGQGYSVAIAQSPNDLVCTLAHASGTTALVDVDNIQLSCSPSAQGSAPQAAQEGPLTFPLSVEVAGLVLGNKLTIQEGVDQVTVGNGQALLAASRAAGSALTPKLGAVTGQSCSLEHPPATMPAAATSLVVLCVPLPMPVSFAAYGLPNSAQLDVASADGNQKLRLTAAAPAGQWPEPLPYGANFTAVLSDVNNRSRCTFGGESTQLTAQVVASSGSLGISCRSFLPLSSGQAAAVVIGQADFISNNQQSGSAGWGASTYGNPHVDVTGALYLTISNGGLLAGYLSVPTANGKAMDFSASMHNTFPDGIATLGQQTALALAQSRQVRLYDQLLRGDQSPTTTLGGDHGCNASGLGKPESVYAAGDTLAVADSANNRVLFWSPWPTGDNAASTGVLGQVDANTCGSISPPGAATLSGPTHIWFDDEMTLVADRENARLLLWQASPSRMNPGQEADIVLGAADMTTQGTKSPTATSFGTYGVVSNGSQIFMCDRDNSRVLVWNSIPKANNQPADVVLGQSDMAASSCNLGGSPSATSMCQCSGLTITDDQVIVNDMGNNRMLVYQPAP